MSNRLRLIVGCVTVAAFAACSSDNTVPTAPAAPATGGLSAANDHASVIALGGPGDLQRHVHEIRTPGDAHAAHGHGGGGSAGTGISYHGGPVLQAYTNVVAIYWSTSTLYNGGPSAGSTGSGSQDGSLVGFFLNNLGGSPYFNINTTYTDGSGRKIANAVHYTGYWANNSNVPADGQSVTDAQMLSMLASGFQSGKIAYDASTLYIIMTPGTVNLGGGFGTQYCAYHWYGTINGKKVLYSAMPYTYAYPSACTAGSAPNGDAAADAEVNVLAHEIEETTTDMYGTAWYDNRGYENADKCAWNFGTTSSNGTGIYNIVVGGKDFLVQGNWINAGTGGCRWSW